MAAPTPTARGTPDGIPLREGYQTLVTVAADPTIELWEKTVTPPGFEGGDPVDFSTMHNTQYFTKAPQTLIDVTDITFVAAYDPEILTILESLINVNTTITVTLPDGSTWAVYGYIKSFIPGEISRRNPPEATVTVVVTNWDPVNSVEAGPAVAEVPGT